MTDHEIRDLLQRAQGGFAPTPQPGTAAILRSRVIDEGGDPREIEPWIRSHGGGVNHQAGTESQTLGRGRRPRSDPYVWYEVPATALGL